jgi:anti-sigma factor RsiW
MTGKGLQDPIMEIDLLAYADGFLDADPARKRAVEAFLRAHPAEAERVNAYIEQNREIRRLYGPVIAEPLPDRLMDVLHGQRGHAGGQWLRAAASVAVLMAAAAGGWLVGFEQHQQQPPSPSQSFVEQALAIHPQTRQTERPARIDLASAGALNRLPEAAALEGDPPDLSSLGYTLQDRRIVDSGGKQMVQMTYVRSDGRRLSLFLGSRAQPNDRKVVFSDSGDVTVAHWLDGPMIYGVVAKGDESELEAVAETIQAAAKHPRRGAASARITPTVEDAGLDEASPPRLVTPEPAVAAPRERIGPIRATR